MSVSPDVDGAQPAATGSLEREYELLERLGRGGMADVYAARDRHLLRTVAVKLLSGRFLEDPGERARFLMEAQVAAQLEHPNIVPFYGLESTATGGLAFSMRLVEGETLSEYFAGARTAARRGETASGPYSLKSRLEHVARVGDALAYAHERGVIHRDVKPRNVMLGTHNQLYLVDWGIARVLAAEGAGIETARHDGTTFARRVRTSDVTDTRFGDITGTVRYMPPEQANGRVDLHGPASDQFALGMMLQEALTLRLPRTSPTPEETLQMAQRGQRDPIRAFEGERIPKAVVKIIERATATDPADRYPSVNALVEDIRRFMRDERVSVWREPVASRIWRRVGQRPEVTLLTFVALLCAAIAYGAYNRYETTEVRRQSAERAVRRANLTAEVMTRGDQLERSLGRAERLLEGLGAATKARLSEPAPQQGRPAHIIYADGSLSSPFPTEMSRRRKQRVGYDNAVFYAPVPPGDQSLDSFLAQIAPLGPVVRQVTLRSHGESAALLPRAQQRARFDASDDLSIASSYVAFPNGAMVGFPAVTTLPAGYDPRTRPFYVNGASAIGPTWGSPYQDITDGGIFLPCNLAVRDAQGRLLAVAGVELRLDELAASLTMPIPGFLVAALVNNDGGLVVRSHPGAGATPKLPHGDAEGIESLVYDGHAPKVVRDAIRAGDTVSQLEKDGSIFVLDRLNYVNLTLVVELDAAIYDAS